MKKTILFIFLIIISTITNAQTDRMVEIDGLCYILNEGNTASLTKNYDHPYSGIIVIPEEIEYNDVLYQVTMIDNYAFYLNTNITSVTISKNLTSISQVVFYGCTAIESIIVSTDNPRYDSRNNCNALIETSTGKVVLGCSNTIIPNGVTSIGNKAFQKCDRLQQINIPDGVTTIGNNAFESCSSLTMITLPASLSSIGSSAFLGCSNISKIYSSLYNPFTVNVFYDNVRNNATLYVPDGCKSVYQSTTGWNFTNIEENSDLNLYNLTYQVDGIDYKTYKMHNNQTIIPEPAPTQVGYTFSGWSIIPETMPAEDVTITGTFSPTQYNLIYKVDGEDYMTVPTDYNSTITPEAEPTRAGCTFSGWSGIPETMPAEDVIVTGSFSVNKYNLIYKVDGEDYKTVQVDYGATITAEAAPTRTGYTFSGWSDIPETMPANDVTISGTFSLNHHNLIYNVDGIQYKSYDVNYNADITPEPYPTKDGFKFGGWIDLPTKMPDEDVVVNGIFIEGEHTITYQVDGVDYKIQVYNHNDPVIPEPEPTREYYTFSGWSAIPETMPAEDLIVTGTFTPEKFHLIYKVDGVEYKNYEIDYQAAITPEAAPTREHFTFSGWSEIPETMPAEDVTINGTFSADKFHLIYKVDGEEYKNYEVAYQSAIAAEEAPTKEGYSFSGWSDIPATMPAEDVTITGTFTICKYNLTYKLDGNVYQTSEVEYGTPLTPIANPSVAVYHTFSGWSEVPATMPAHDVDIIGTSVPNKYNLTYKYSYSGNLFDYTTYKTVKVEYGATITPEPNATQEGYTFSGWSGVPATMPAYDVTVTGLFTANFYKLTYQVSGKASNSYSIRFGSTITPEAAPTVDGFTFNGWVGLPATMPAHDVTVNASLTKNATSSVTYPADWDMTGWSEETVSNLESDSKWYKSEYRYSYNGSCPKDESIELIANGVKIKETAGIEFAISNCSLFTISTKEGGLYNVNIEVFESSNFFFVLKNMKRGQKVSIDFRSVDWYTDNDLFPQPVGAVKMTDRPITRAQRTESSVADYIVSADGDVRFNVNADKFFYLYNVDVTAVSNDYLSYLSNTEGINNQIDCYLYWNGKSSSAIGPWGSSYARGADVRIENKSNQTMTITRIELYDGATSLKTVTDLNGDLAPGNYKDFSFSVSSTSEMPSTLPWMEVYYDVNGASYIKKFVSDGTQPPGSSSSGESGGSDESGTGINDHRADEENGEHEDIYTIDGKKLGSYPTKKGLYIKNGKKFVVK